MSTKHDEASSRYGHLPLAARGPLECPLLGNEILQSSFYNKGSAFTIEERHELDLHGFLPSNVQTLEEQAKRAYDQYASRTEDLAKNTFMTSLKEQNDVLYYKLVQDHMKEMMPIIYTPTEGTAIENFSRLFRRPHGCFLSIEEANNVEANLSKFGKPEDVDYIVVSDGEEILGIGDQGVGGILISVAKLVLTTLCAGVHPARTLPVVLDCGTNNEELLNDDLYLGLKQTRVRGKRYDDFVENFVRSARKRFPNAYIHFEDFGLPNARRILDRYTSQIPCFNDDVQGTGAVTLAAIMAGAHVSGVKLEEMRIVVFGSGTAGTGIADQIRDAIAEQTKTSKEDASKSIWCVDKPGLLLQSHKDDLTPAQEGYARPDSDWPSSTDPKDLKSIVAQVKPHVLIGTSTRPGSFTEEVVREMCKHVERPIILPLSNPTRLHEAVPKDVIAWSEGKALVATGSPFDPVKWNDKTYEIAECNNSTIFPSIGLGVILSRSTHLTTPMIVAATKALASLSPALEDPEKGLLPDVEIVRQLTVPIATAVVMEAVNGGTAGVKSVKLGEGSGPEGRAGEGEVPAEEEEVKQWVKAQMWEPVYRKLVPKKA